ncbi:MAG: biopolymer transporter ExbD [Rhodothermaceae bacterium]|nr:MAG: biopolymer transporter ExbD [Bacteroidota bacterium]GIV62378.1 MAG: biopolymer transporter ExbD [Rhodothermaceae bacterium]
MSAINFSTSKKPLTAFSLAGLADIVLLLLIFFLLTSSFIPQFGIQVNLPQASTSAPMEAQYVSVTITDDGRFYVNQRQVPREGLLDAIREARENRTALVLRADREATVGDFARVAAIARALNLRVLMATERDGSLP